jgi:hypothetical protein
VQVISKKIDNQLYRMPMVLSLTSGDEVVNNISVVFEEPNQFRQPRYSAN